MSEKYTPVKGDRVRVVLEGTVTDEGNIMSDNQDFCLYKNVRRNAVSIEKIEPPVETFKPGDVVRHKDDLSGHWFALAEDGWLITGPGWVIKRTFISGDPSEFTTDNFELVPLG